MGHWKHVQAERDAQYQRALGILCEVGALNECENHAGTYFDGGGDVEDAYKLANARVTAGKITLKAGDTRHDLTDAIKKAYDDNSALEGCQECEHTFGPD